jgi:carboxymethylenebutenolidase
MKRKKASDFDPELLGLFHRYVHGGISRRDFLDGAAPVLEGVPNIKASLLLHFAEHDPNINKRWPDYEAALKANGVKFDAHMYPGTNHGFHNDTTPRFDEAAAKLAWQRTLDFFNKQLKS